MQPIFNAILQNDLPAFLGLVEEQESSLDEVSKELKNTVLHMAAKLGRRELVSKIIELRPSLVFSCNAYGNTPLHLAALLGDVNIVEQMLDSGFEVCSARNDNNETPFHLACRSISMEVARLIAEKTVSVNLDELSFAISSGFNSIVGIILERFPDLATEEAWVVDGGSLSTLLHHACDEGDIELTCLLLGLNQRLEKTLNTEGLTPLHLAVLRGSVGILSIFLDKSPLSFGSLTPSQETVFHLAARNKNTDAFIFMGESFGVNSKILMQQTDENDNTVLHTAASVACGAPLIKYIVGKKIVDITHTNKLGLEAYQVLPPDAQDFELLSRWLRLDTKTAQDLDYIQSLGHNKPLGICTISDESKVIQLLDQIVLNTSEIAFRAVNQGMRTGRQNLEYEMHIEALQNARNTIAIVAVLIASVAYAGGINPPGGVYQDGPWKGKSMVGKTTAFKVFEICNNIALFVSLCIVILLVSIIPYKRKPLKRLLVATHRMMWVSVGFMAAAYIAATWVTIPHYHDARWLFPAIVACAGGALLVLFSYLGIKTIGHWLRKMNLEGDIPSFARTSSDLAVSEQSGYFTY